MQSYWLIVRSISFKEAKTKKARLNAKLNKVRVSEFDRFKKGDGCNREGDAILYETM